MTQEDMMMTCDDDESFQFEDAFWAARTGDLPELLTALDTEGKDVKVDLQTIRDQNGNTLLHMAAANGHLSIVEHLLKGCIGLVHATNGEGNTPLHWAALNNQLAVVERLCEAGADVSKQNGQGHTAIFEAEQRGLEDIIKALVMKLNLDDMDGVDDVDNEQDQDNSNDDNDDEEMAVDQ